METHCPPPPHTPQHSDVCKYHTSIYVHKYVLVHTVFYTFICIYLSKVVHNNQRKPKFRQGATSKSAVEYLSKPSSPSTVTGSLSATCKTAHTREARTDTEISTEQALDQQPQTTCRASPRHLIPQESQTWTTCRCCLPTT